MHPNWRTLATVDFTWKNFVTSSVSNSELVKGKDSKHLKPTQQPLNGEEAKNFYEGIISQDESSKGKYPIKKESAKDELPEKPSAVVRQKPTPKQEAVVEQININIFLRYIEQGDETNVLNHIEQGFDINQQDNFGWTPLHSAVCAQKINIVKLLLQYGADTSVTDNTGRTALKLAKQKGYKHIIKCFYHSKHTSEHDDESHSAIVINSEIYCDVCQLVFKEATSEEHQNSTLHLLNKNKDTKPRTVYGISQVNRGYQMLLNGGWDPERGLGPDGSGKKFPLKTILKRDRKGLGTSHSKARVTHFLPRDPSAVKRVPKSSHLRVEKLSTLRKKANNRRELRVNEKEIQYRQEFNF